MPCAINLRTDTVATNATPGGSWTYEGVSDWTVRVDGVMTTLSTGEQIGTTDNPLVETDSNHVGNSYSVKYTVPATAGCPAVDATYTIVVSEEPCDIGDGSVDICEGSTSSITLADFVDTAACGSTPTIDEWTLISGDGSGLNTGAGTFDPTGYLAGATIVVQAKINGSTNGFCQTCNDKTANVTINITSGADAGPGGNFNVCA